ncbi:hypothetical protein BX600DRAFT_474615 [Xylariales sp. PMI_506]|nr:hypothetical protein BX600DRAFT_474615 [Xylariales sp. PMI_506]
MDVYLLPSPFSASPDYRFWQPPQILCYQGNSPQGVNVVTAGGLVRHGETIYMVVVDDVSLMGWSTCTAASSSTKAKDHRRCGQVCKYIEYHYNLQQESVGVVGKMVHFSVDHGYGLVRITSEWLQGDEEAVGQAAISIDDLGRYVDGPQVMDFVEFITASGEEVTGVVEAAEPCCVDAGGSRVQLNTFRVNTSSYCVKPEDCGTWVRRSIASPRPLLLGHIIGCSQNGGTEMLMLPFGDFKDDLRRIIRRRAFNMLG